MNNSAKTLLFALFLFSSLFLQSHQVNVTKKNSSLTKHYLKAFSAYKNGYYSKYSYHLKEAEREIEKGSDTNQKIHFSSHLWWRPLHFAVFFRELSHLNFLYAHKCNINLLDSRKRSPLAASILLAKESFLQKSFSKYHRSNSIAKLLLHLDANPNQFYQNKPLLHFAIFLPDITELMLKKGANPNGDNGSISLLGEAYFQAYRFQSIDRSITNRLLDSSKHLVKAGSLTNRAIQQSDVYFSYPLHYAVMLGLVDHVKLLLKQRAKTYYLDSLGYSPLSICLNQLDLVNKGIYHHKNSHLQIAEMLIQQGANLYEIHPHFEKSLADIITSSVPELWNILHKTHYQIISKK